MRIREFELRREGKEKGNEGKYLSSRTYVAVLSGGSRSRRLRRRISILGDERNRGRLIGGRGRRLSAIGARRRLIGGRGVDVGLPPWRWRRKLK